MKRYTTIQLNVKVTDTTADQIKRLAAFNQITVAEQLRRFIEEGLSVNSNAQHIDLIASIIRQELMAIYHPADIQRLVAGQLEETLKKFENTQRKSGKASAAGYFLLLDVPDWQPQRGGVCPDGGTGRATGRGVYEAEQSDR